MQRIIGIGQMGNQRAYMGHFDRDGFLSLVESAHRDAWSGVVRLRSARKVGAMWMIKGYVVHALQVIDGMSQEGITALENLAEWETGTYYLDAGVLPPARTIRLDMPDVLMKLRHIADIKLLSEADHNDSSSDLNGILQSLRKRVPGLESLSLSHGAELETTTAIDAAERAWIYDHVQQYCSDNTAVPEKLFLQQDDHLLLIVKKGNLAAVLSAHGQTAPEALLWAGEEARKMVLDSDSNGKRKVHG